MSWELKRAKDMPFTMDNSGIYCIINRVAKRLYSKGYGMDYVEIRIDLMQKDDMPLVSFIGSADDVRKAATRWLEENGYKISTEHASYIGSEIMRAYHDFRYVQD